MSNSAMKLIITIVDSGFSELVMDTAKKVGVKGGTITHCRGTSSESMAKKYGVYVTPDKEMIWIVASADIADNVLTAIHDTVADVNPGRCFVFSLPVDNVAGMKLDPDVAGSGQ